MQINTTIKTVSSYPQALASTTPAPAGKSTTSLSPKQTEGMGVARYRKAKMRVKYYELKKQIMGSLTKGEQFLLDRFRSRLKKLRKIAAPELIQNLIKRKAAKGRGKRRGSDLSKLMSGKIKS